MIKILRRLFERHYLDEMVIAKEGIFGATIEVHGKEKRHIGQPHFHLIYKDGTEFSLTFKDFEILYSKKRYNIPPNSWRLIRKLFQKKHKGLIETNWQTALVFWNAGSERYPVDLNISIPENYPWRK